MERKSGNSKSAKTILSKGPFLPAGAAVFVDDDRFGQTPASQGYVRFECSDQFSESNWTECII